MIRNRKCTACGDDVCQCVIAELATLKNRLGEMVEAISWFSESQEWDSILDGPLYYMLSNITEQARAILKELEG